MDKQAFLKRRYEAELSRCLDLFKEQVGIDRRFLAWCETLGNATLLLHVAHSVHAKRKYARMMDRDSIASLIPASFFNGYYWRNGLPRT